MHSSVHAVTLTFLVAVSWAKTPQVVRWNTTNYYGPDGPWQVRLQFRVVIEKIKELIYSVGNFS